MTNYIELIKWLRNASQSIYLTTEASVADEISPKLLKAAEAITALSRTPEVVAEWQIRIEDGDWIKEDASLLKQRRAQGYEIRALYTHPSAPQKEEEEEPVAWAGDNFQEMLAKYGEHNVRPERGDYHVIPLYANPPAPQSSAMPKSLHEDYLKAAWGIIDYAKTGQKPGERATQGSPVDEQSGETSPSAPQPPAELWALCYLHDWDPPKEGQEHRWEPGKNVFPEVHAFYTSWQEAEAIRKDMMKPEKYWVVRARSENEARLARVAAPQPPVNGDVVAAIARRIFEDEHRGLSNCHGWNSSGLDDEHSGSRERYYRYATSAIAALSASPLQGYVLVPQEPTEAMCEFAEDNFDRNSDPIAVCYRAMLSARPKGGSDGVA